MAKAGNNDERARVKLRVIEFELEGSNASVESSIRQLTTALTARSSAARPLITRQSKEISNEESPGAESGEPAGDSDVLDSESIEVAPDAETPKVPKSRSKLPIPNYLHDLDLKGNGISFKDFAAAKAPNKHTTRYLVAALWLRDHGNSPTITTDKVFSCYRTAGWPLNITDWDSNFRSQVRNDRFRRVETGEYAITPLGENDLRAPDGTT